MILSCAGATQRPGQSRLDLVEQNLRVLQDSLSLVRSNPRAILVMVSNPVDVLTLGALRLTGRPPSRVMGSGTVLDSARFRLGIDPRNVHACVVGEHGDTEVPLRSRVRVAGLTVPEVEALAQRPLGDRQVFFARVREAAQDAAFRTCA